MFGAVGVGFDGSIIFAENGTRGKPKRAQTTEFGFGEPKSFLTEARRHGGEDLGLWIGTLRLCVSVRDGSGSEGCHPELVEGSGLHHARRLAWGRDVSTALDMTGLKALGGLLGANPCSFVSVRGWTQAAT